MFTVANDTYLTEPEAAERIGRSSRTLFRWRMSRSGPPHIRLGGEIAYRESAIAEWLRSLERSAAA
jgi:predicted DNA-binding transcriptional regulator AlpA